ncbi:hypothetical protein MyChFU_49580 [Mycobacterium intracellulare subsp. chimaera]
MARGDRGIQKVPFGSGGAVAGGGAAEAETAGHGGWIPEGKTDVIV